MAPRELLAAIYRATAQTVIGPGETYVQEYFFKLGADHQYHPNPVHATVKAGRICRCPQCHRKAKTLLWVDVEAEGGVVGLRGPFCGLCFKDHRASFEPSEGTEIDLPVYYLRTSPDCIQAVEAAVLDGWGAPEVPKPTPSDFGNLF